MVIIVKYFHLLTQEVAKTKLIMTISNQSVPQNHNYLKIFFDFQGPLKIFILSSYKKSFISFQNSHINLMSYGKGWIHQISLK